MGNENVQMVNIGAFSSDYAFVIFIAVRARMMYIPSCPLQAWAGILQRRPHTVQN